MKINLTRVRTYYINIYGAKKRAERTLSILNALGFKFASRSPGFAHKNKVTGSSLAYHNVLESRHDKGDPFILFEDDILVTHFDHIIDIPDDADAVYLGVSKMGVIDGSDKEELLVSKVDGYDNLYRVYNMLASHAILYLNMDYVKSAADACQRCIDQGIPHDLGLAENMKDWKVYAFDKPMFIQDPKFRYYTDTPISKLENVTLVEESANKGSIKVPSIFKKLSKRLSES